MDLVRLGRKCREILHFTKFKSVWFNTDKPNFLKRSSFGLLHYKMFTAKIFLILPPELNSSGELSHLPNETD